MHTHSHTHNRDTMIVVWNARSAIPVRTFFDAHPGGIISLDITPDAMYIATVGAGANQDLSIWEWTVQSDEPMCTAGITSKDVQHCVRFKRDDYTEIITNGSVVCVHACVCVCMYEPMCSAGITSKDVQHCVRFKRDNYTEIITNGSVVCVCVCGCVCACVRVCVYMQINTCVKQRSFLWSIGSSKCLKSYSYIRTFTYTQQASKNYLLEHRLIQAPKTLLICIHTFTHTQQASKNYFLEHRLIQAPEILLPSHFVQRIPDTCRTLHPEREGPDS